MMSPSPLDHIPSRNSLTTAEKFERALWEADTAIQDAKDLIGDLFPTNEPEHYTRSVITSGMLLAMLQIASATLTSVKNLHADSRKS